MKRRSGRTAQWVIAAAGSLVASIALAELPQGGGKPSAPVDFVGKVDEHNAKRLCAEPLATNK